MIWGHDGTKTAGYLTRKIMKLIEEENKKEIRDIKIDLVLEADTTCDEMSDQMNKK
jgi:hypothetical protein